MRTLLSCLRTTLAAWLVCAAAGGTTLAGEPAATPRAPAPPFESSDWTGFVLGQVVPPDPAVPPLPAEPPADVVPPGLVIPPAQVGRPGEVVVPPAEVIPTPPGRTPLLDGRAPHEELLPQVVGEPYGRRPVRPYGGGHPTDWWGCGGSPYRTGPGVCDNWKVGPRWHVTVDGWVMHRPGADLPALIARQADPDFWPGDLGVEGVPRTEQFDYAPGGRITFISQVPHYVGYQIYAAYEGVEEWNASIVYPIQELDVPDFAIQPDPDTHPPDPYPEGFEQRSLHYRSNLHSGQLNWVHELSPDFRPFCGARFIRFNEKLTDRLHQQVQPPLPGPQTDNIQPGGIGPIITVTDPIGPSHETDRLNAYDIDNQLMGFQIGALYDIWHLNERVSLTGFVNAGLYYNRVKYSNLRGVFTTQVFADNTRTPTIFEGRTDFSDAAIHDVSRHSEIATVSEASLTAVCRLNKCWALRSGYQVLWINNVHLAEDAFLFGATDGSSLFFHGWHAGIECRR